MPIFIVILLLFDLTNCFSIYSATDGFYALQSGLFYRGVPNSHREASHSVRWKNENEGVYSWVSGPRACPMRAYKVPCQDERANVFYSVRFLLSKLCVAVATYYELDATLIKLWDRDLLSGIVVGC